eukprot:7847504-Lingulodinium_polyedra.AAC.1
MADQRQGLQCLERAWAVFSAAKQLAAGSTFLDKLVKKSSFQATAVQEAAALATSPDGPPLAARLQTLHKFSLNLFTGWGQTKVVEDGLKQLREAERAESTNGRLEVIRQWGVLRDREVVGLHKREEIKPEVSEDAPKPSLPQSLFICWNKAPTLADAATLLHKADWPTLTAQ